MSSISDTTGRCDAYATTRGYGGFCMVWELNMVDMVGFMEMIFAISHGPFYCGD